MKPLKTIYTAAIRVVGISVKYFTELLQNQLLHIFISTLNELINVSRVWTSYLPTFCFGRASNLVATSQQVIQAVLWSDTMYTGTLRG